MKCLTKSWLRPSKRSASVNLPSDASKTYCLSTFTQGSARRSAASTSRNRVSSFSLTNSALRASSHPVRVTIFGLFMVFSSPLTLSSNEPAPDRHSICRWSPKKLRRKSAHLKDDEVSDDAVGRCRNSHAGARDRRQRRAGAALAAGAQLPREL